MQLLPRVDPATLPAQPLAVEQVRPGELGPQPGPREPLDRFSIETLGGVAFAEEGTASSCDSQAPVRTAVVSYLMQPLKTVAQRSRVHRPGRRPQSAR